MDHLLLGCCYTREVWECWVRKLHLQHVLVRHEHQAIACWLHNRKLLPKSIRHGFDSLFFLIGWLIWKEWNARTFNGEATTPMQLCFLVQDEVDSWSLAGYMHLMSLMALV
jgi:hypothetical protein